jgi:hypothetical protein
MTHRRGIVTLAALSAVLAASGGRAQSSEAPQLRPVRTVHDLQELRPDTPDMLAVVAGFHTPGDGGGGLFVWRSGLADKPDGGTVIGSEDATVPGRWCRVHDGPLNVRMFGAAGDGKTDDTAAIQAAMDAAAGAELRIPAGTWLVSRTLHFRSPAGRHSTGLKLVGDGMMATTIDSRVADGPLLSIEQARAYAFGKGGLIRDIEFLGLNAPAGRNQHGIVMSGAWLYHFERLTIRSFKGHGVLVPFMTDRGFVYTDVDIVAGSKTAHRPKGTFPHTVLGAETILGDGIEPGTLVDRVVDDETITMTKPATQSGRVSLDIFGRNPDGQQTLLFAEDCRIIWNDGWGVYGSIGVGFSLTLRDCEVGVNKTGGIRTDGYLEMHGGSVGVNGTNDGKGIGILLESDDYSGAHRAHIEGVEIDGNKEVNLWLRRVRFAQVVRCRFNASEWDKLGVQFPKVSIRLGDRDGSAATTVEFDQNMVRADGRHLWPHTGFEIPDGAVVDNVVARNTLFWGGWSEEHHTKFHIGKLANQDAQVRFDEEGRLSRGTAVPVQYFAQLQGLPEGDRQIPAAVALVLPFGSVLCSQPRLAANWPIAKIEATAVSADGDELRLETPPRHALVRGMPVLILRQPDTLDPAAISSMATVVAVTNGTVAKLDRPVGASGRVAALAGGATCPYASYFAVDVTVDMQASDKAQEVAMTLLVDGKPWRTENSQLHGLSSGETVRLSVTGSWPAGAALHVGVRNASAAPISLKGATMTVRLLT